MTRLMALLTLLGEEGFHAHLEGKQLGWGMRGVAWVERMQRFAGGGGAADYMDGGRAESGLAKGGGRR